MGNQKSIETPLKEGTFACNSHTTKNGNIIWAAAMQLAWNQLRNKFASQKPIKLKTNQPSALQMIKNFNMGLFTTKDIDDKCIYVKSGYGQHAVQTINKQVKAKFPKKTIAPLQDKLTDTDIISYAYLFKELVFEVQFGATKEKEFKFNGKAVKSFYGKNAEQNKQVKLHYYKNNEQFMVEIRGKQNKDSLFLIKDQNVQTVQQALISTINRVNKIPQTLTKHDKFEMPVIDLDVKRQYKQLLKIPFENEELRQYYIQDMTEILKLNIDENGARVQNEAKIVATRSMSIQFEPKFIILDSSFWIVMKEVGKKPYLCVFVNNPQDKQ